MRWTLLLLGLALAPGGAVADSLAVTGARLYPVAAAPIDDGVLVVDGGRIVAVGAAGEVEVPADAVVVDLAGKVILPGLVDSHSHVGRVAGGDDSGPLQPEVRALDAVDIKDTGFVRALAGGVTTVNVMPGSGHLMSGQTVYLKLRREGQRIEDWLFCDDALRGICGGLKMANGTNSMEEPPFPGTRGKSAALVRQLFVDAREYRQRRQLPEGERPPRDLGKETLLEVLDGRRIVHFHTHRHDDVATVLRLAREFGFAPVLQHGSEAWMVGKEIAAAGLIVSMTLLDSPGGKEEILELRPDGPARLRQAGVEVALNTDDLIDDSRWFLRLAALAVRYGLSRDDALAAVTLVGAKALGLADRVGSLAPGKDADFVVLSGDPFSVYTVVEETWVEGRRVFDLDEPGDRAVARGGYGVLGEETTHAH